MATKTIWGVIGKDGTVLSGSKDYQVNRDSSDQGQYTIVFNQGFSNLPAITGNQVNYGSLGEDPSDGVVFPELTRSYVKVIVGNTSSHHEARTFSFIAIGDV